MYRFVATRLCAAVALAAVLAAPAAAASPATYTSTLLMEAAPVPGAYGLAFDADDVLYVGSAGLQVTAMDKETGEIIKVYGPAPEWGADDLAFGPDGSLYNTAILNGTVGKLAPDGSHTILNETPILGVNPVAVSDDGRLFVGIALMGDALYEFDPTGATEPRLINEGLGLNGFDWWDGYLWAPRMYTGELVRIDVDSGEVTTIADGFTYSTSADVGPDGMVYVNDNGAQQIVKVDPQTGSKTIVAPIGGDNMAISSTGRLFLSNGDNARVVEILPDGTIREVSQPGLTTGGGGIAVASGADGAPVVYVPDIFGFYAITGDTGAEVPTASGQAFGAMTAGAYGTDVVTTSWFDGTLQVWDPVAGEVVADYSEALTATPINAVGLGDDIVVAELSGEGSPVVRIDGTTGQPTVLATMAVPTGLATDGTDLWVADWATGTVSQLIKDGETIDPVVVASGLAQPEGLAFSPDGQLLVYETGAARVSTIDPSDGTVTPLIEGLDAGFPGPATMPPSFILAGVAVDDAGSIYVSSHGVHRFDPQP